MVEMRIEGKGPVAKVRKIPGTEVPGKAESIFLICEPADRRGHSIPR